MTVIAMTREIGSHGSDVAAGLANELGPACVRTICQLAREPRFQDDAATISALADKLLETRVSAALSDEIAIGEAPAGVIVSAANGTVTLKGASSSGNLRAKAEKVAFCVAGVCAIDNHITSLPNRGGSF